MRISDTHRGVIEQLFEWFKCTNQFFFRERKKNLFFQLREDKPCDNAGDEDEDDDEIEVDLLC